MTLKAREHKLITWTHLPEEVWIDILSKLRLTDLALVSQTSIRLNQITRLSIDTYHRHDSPFTGSYEFSHEGVPIEPDINAESGLAICFDELTSTLKVLHLSTGSVIASSPETNSFPVSLKFSKAGNFVAVCFDTKVRFYALDFVREKLIPCREVKFDVRIRDFVPPGYGRCRYGMGRMLVSFSRSDKKLAVAHIFESLGLNHYVTFKCLTARLLDDDVVGKAAIDYDRLSRSMSAQEATTVRLKVHREFVSFWDIHMNADPLFFLIPPNCMHESGFLLDPKKPESMLLRRIEEYDGKLGHLIGSCFSACGQHYFETRQIPGDMTCNLTITKFELASGLPTSITEVPMDDFNTVLEVLISNDSKLAVILLGIISSDTAKITAWYVANLCGEGYVYVRCKQPILTTQYDDLDRTFGLSDDGQLLSVSCDLKDHKRYYMVKVFETATGLDVDALTCAVPNGGHFLHADWHGSGGCACYHVFGGRHRSTLTMFTTCDTGVSFSHAS